MRKCTEKFFGFADPEFENGFSKKQNDGYKMANIFWKNHHISVKVGVYRFFTVFGGR